MFLIAAGPDDPGVVERDPKQLVVDVGRRVAELRMNAGLTQEQLAVALRVSTRWVQRLEQRGENLTLHTLVKLANTLEVTPQSLLDEPSPEARAARGPGRPPKR